MKGAEFPDRPWATVGVVFFQHKDKNYLVAVDYFSRCLFIENWYKFDLRPAVDGLQFECLSNHCKTVMSDSSISS